MLTDRTVVSRVFCLLSLATLASCFGKPINIKAGDAAVAGQQSDSSGAGGEVGHSDGPGPVADSKVAMDGSASNGGAGGNSGIGDSSGGDTGTSATAGADSGSATGGTTAAESGTGGSGGSTGGAITGDAGANGGSSAGGSSGGGSGGTGGGIAGSSGIRPDAAPDIPPDVPAIDAPGTCSADKDCTSQAPFCLGNLCAKCAGDSDCAGRAGPACTASGLCVACTANKHCTGTAAACDTTTNQCVGCVTRSDCAAVKGKDDPGFCDGTCDSAGACKKKQGQTCQKVADCADGIPCADGYCCDKACGGSCQACNVATSLGTCTTLAANEQPHEGHPACTATDPGCAGSCQGSAACSYPASACGTAACTANGSYQGAGTCNNGACAMPTPQACASGKYCTGGACVPLVANGGTCQSSGQCVSGNCSSSTCCAAGLTGCGGACVSLSTSNTNCGSCGRSCATGSTCAGGSCYLNDGQSCTTGSQCLTGTCSTFYVDGDHDTYGTNAFIQQCGTTIPTGYANRSGDCCDSDPNAKPGQSNTYSTPDACGSYDYNCDGQATPKINLPADGTCGSPLCSFSASRVCQDFGGCTCIGSDGLPTCDTYNTKECGATYGLSHDFCQQMGPDCYPFGISSPAGTQECN